MAVNVTGGALDFSASIDMSAFEQSISRIQQQLQGLTTSANNQSKAIENVASKAALAIGSYLSLNAATQFIKQIVEVRGQFEQLGVAFETMLNSKEKADKLMAEVVQLAATTPFTLQDVATGAKQLLAYGTQAEDVTKTLRMLGDVASGVGAPIQDLVYLYGTLQTQGRAYTRDILQFTSRGIPIIAELAKQFHVSTQEVQQLVEAGKIGFPEVQKAFQAMTTQGGMFFNLMDKQSQTVTGQLSNLSDAFSQMLNNIGQSNEGIIKGTIGGLTDLVQNYQAVIDIIEVLITSYGVYKAAVMAQSAVVAVYSVETKGLAIAETLYATAASIAQKATALLNTTLLANPYAAIAALLVGLGVALYEMRDSTTALEKATKSLREEEQQATQQKQDLLSKTRDLLTVIQSETSTRLSQLEAFKELQRLYPGYLASVDLQKFKTIDAKDAQLEFNKAIEAADLARKEKEIASLSEQLVGLKNNLKATSNSDSPIANFFAKGSYSQDIDTITQKIKLLKKNIDETKEAQFEANASPDELVKHYEGVLDSLKQQRDQLEKTVSLSKAAGAQFLGWKDTIAQLSLSSLDKEIAEISGKLGKLINPQTQSNKQLIDASASLETLDALRSKILADYNKETDKSRREQLAKDLEYADKRKKILDVYGAENKAAKTQESLETRINTILDQRQGILDKISTLQRDSKQSGLLQDASAIDQVKQKYDEALGSIEAYNKKIDDFNKKNGTNLKGIGLADVDKLRQAEQIEVANTAYKQDSVHYLEALALKKQAFDDFENIQKQGNEDATQQAKAAYSEQLQGFTSFLGFLKDQADNLKFFIKVEPDNIGLQQSLVAVNKQITEESNKQKNDAIKQRTADYQTALQDAMTYNDKRKEIDTKYTKDVLAIAGNFDDKQRLAHLAALKQGHEQELTDLQNSLLRQSALYQQLNEDIVGFTRKQLKERIDLLKKELMQGFVIDPQTKIKTPLTPQMQADLKAGLDSANGLYVATDKTANNFDKIAEKANEGEQAFRNLASAVGGINQGLSDAINLVADLVAGVANASKSLSDFKKAKDNGDTAGQISAGIGIAGAAIGVASSVFEFFKAAHDSSVQAQKELKAYQDSLITGEVTYNELMRDRLRTQGDITKMTAAELQTRQQMLNLQKQQALADYNKLLAQIQNAGSQITGEHTEKTGGFLGIGKKTKTVQELAGLSDTDYATLEKLFTEGKLDDATSKWFQELKKVHDELDSIGETADQLKDQLNQILTGTTSDAISSSIKDGIANGYDSAADFANNLQDLFRNAILSAFEANQIKPAMQKFYDDLAQFNSDGLLDQNEIDQLTKVYNTTVDSLAQQYDQIKQIANLPGANDTANSLQGALKGMTEQTGELLAGQFGAQRLTLVEILNIATQQLNQLNAIANNTYYLLSVDSRLRDLQTNGIKIK